MAFRSSATTSTNTGANLTASPAGAVANDALVAFLAINNNGSSATPPSGWALKSSISVGGAGAQTLLCYTKVATGSDSFTWTAITGSSFAELWVGAYTGRDTSAPFTVAAVTTANASSNSTPFTASLSGIAANANDDVVVGLTLDGVSTDRWTTSPFYTGSVTYNERADFADVNYVQLAVNDALNQSGATGTISADCTRTSGTGQTSYCAIVITIAAAAGGGSTGTIAASLAAVTAALSGSPTDVGTLTTTLANVAASLSGSPEIVGTVSPVLDNITASLSGSVGSSVSGAISATTDNTTAALSGTTTIVGAISTTLAAVNAALSGTTTIIGNITATLANTIAYIYQLSTSTVSAWWKVIRRRRR